MKIMVKSKSWNEILISCTLLVITYGILAMQIGTFNEKFNFHLGPTIDFMTEHTKRFDPDSEVDLAFQFGLGYNINKNIGIIE